MTTTAAPNNSDNGQDEYPLLILQSPPEAIAAMLDDVRADLGPDVVEFLRQAKVLGRVIAVLLECKVAGHTPNLLEAIALANVEKEACTLIRLNHSMEFSVEDFDAIIAHAQPAMIEQTKATVLSERNPKGRFKAC